MSEQLPPKPESAPSQAANPAAHSPAPPVSVTPSRIWSLTAFMLLIVPFIGLFVSISTAAYEFQILLWLILAVFQLLFAALIYLAENIHAELKAIRIARLQ